jgi:hypothetical protein
MNGDESQEPRVTNFTRKKFWTICLGFTLSLPPETTKVSAA